MTDAAASAADAVKGAATAAKDAVADAAGSAPDQAAKAADAASKAADRAAGTVSKEAAQAASTVKDEAAKAAGTAKAETAKAVDKAKDGAAKAVDQAKAATGAPADAEPAPVPPRSMDEIEAELAATRERLAGRLDELQEYVSPKNLIGRQVEKVKGVFVDEYGGIKPDKVLIAAGAVVGVVVLLGVLGRRRRG